MASQYIVQSFAGDFVVFQEIYFCQMVRLPKLTNEERTTFISVIDQRNGASLQIACAVYKEKYFKDNKNITVGALVNIYKDRGVYACSLTPSPAAGQTNQSQNRECKNTTSRLEKDE